MKLSLGIKSDPVEYRYSYEWLISIMDELDIRYMQLGSFFELYSLEDDFFHALREQAFKKNILIKSCFTSHRELGGFMTGDPYLERAARRNWERYLHAASVLGVDYAGSNMGAVYRDRPEHKRRGIKCYIRHMKELLALAREKSLKALTLEPMSCMAEPPSTREEISSILKELNDFHRAHPDTTVPLYLCSDITHGLADQHGQTIQDNVSLFEHGISFMAEFHFKNTDERFEATFGFSEEECRRGIVDLEELKGIIEKNKDKFPVDHVVGYLETDGPKRGRDYSDPQLEQMLSGSLTTLKRVFG